MGLFDKVFGKTGAKPVDKHECEVCYAKVNRADGYFLTTSQVLLSQAYWEYDLTNHGQSFKIEDKGKMLPFITESRANNTDPWLVCERCSRMFDFDRILAKNCAVNNEVPPGNGRADTFRAVQIAKEAWTKLCYKKNHGITAFDRSKQLFDSAPLKDVKLRIKNDPHNSENYRQLEELLSENGYWFEAKKSCEERCKTKIPFDDMRETLQQYKSLYKRFYAQCFEERQPFCTECHTELKYIGNMSDDLTKNGNWIIIRHVPEKSGELQQMYDTWLGTVCTKCHTVYCHKCLEIKPRACPECGEAMSPANLHYLTELVNS